MLATGPTGSGKSTHLYAALNEINEPHRKIITIEDPVEYQIAGVNQLQVNLKAGLTFASGLRAMPRADPDVIMVGEIRDGETAKIAVESALTGHLVLSTLHTNDAPSALTRLTEMGIEPVPDRLRGLHVAGSAARAPALHLLQEAHDAERRSHRAGGICWSRSTSRRTSLSAAAATARVGEGSDRLYEVMVNERGDSRLNGRAGIRR